MADKLWWMSKQDSASISPLHRQRVKRRAIVVTEDPKLHLVWIHDRVFVKPLPRYCYRVRKAILGYIRTYRYLVRYESDFRIAQEPDLELIPSATQLYAPLLLCKSYFQRVDYQYGTYFARLQSPILFWLGTVSVVLSGLQVTVAVEEHQVLWAFALRFSIAMIAFAGALLFFLVSLIIYKVAKEWRFAVQDRRRLLREEGRGNCLSP
ncbi:hypothetical protein LZ31DRAFT_589635 [Colletotrichum somersetense]|nr:hypothetical protein LZ31DRAFT_589635 [Colletotrichum somersetense]